MGVDTKISSQYSTVPQAADAWMDIKFSKMVTRVKARLMILRVRIRRRICVCLFCTPLKISNAGGTKKQKYLCVGCTVASCVCLMTAVQIVMMFRNVLFE